MMITKEMRVGVLMGGLSSEHDISLQSGQAVTEALVSRGYNVVPLVVDRSIDRALRAAEVDMVFNALHGRYGEDGCIQGLLELLGIPYTGSSVLASALALNKVKAKEIFRLHNLPTPAYYALSSSQLEELDEIHGSFGFPVVVKPNAQGSSFGVAIATDRTALRAACLRAFELDDTILIERHIAGKEVCVGIVGQSCLGALGIVSHHEIFDYDAKYTRGLAHYHMPARLSAERYRGVLNQALRAHAALGCTGATRVDMIVSELGNEYILEVNTVPGLTRGSLLPRIARHTGMSYDDLIERILQTAALHSAVTARAIHRDHQASGVVRQVAKGVRS